MISAWGTKFLLFDYAFFHEEDSEEIIGQLLLGVVWRWIEIIGQALIFGL